MSAPQILIIDNDPSSSQSLQRLMQSAGYETTHARSLPESEKLLESRAHHLLLMECLPPKPQTIDTIKRLRQRFRSNELPIIMLTARDDEIDRLEGFEAGVDDCISKPYFQRELVARVSAVLRRTSMRPARQQLKQGPVVIDLGSHRAKIHGKSLALGPTEFALLQVLVEHAERVMSRQELRDKLWDDHSSIEDRTVDVHILRLRKVLRTVDFDHCIQTVRSIGYRFSLEAGA